MCVATHAAAPTLDHFYPAGGQQGTTVSVSVVGKTDPWPAKVWTDTTGLTFTPDKDKGKYQVIVATNAPPGPHLVRLYNDEGASRVRFFMVGQTREELDKEPNDEFSKPQAVEQLPSVINGKLDRSGDVDSFAVHLKAGQTLVAALNAYTLASTMDGLMRIVDTNGVTHAFNHDSHSFDPLVAFQAKHAGIYVIQVMAFPYPANASENLAGGAGYIYRLTLTTNGWLDHAFPPVLPRTGTTQVKVTGWNLRDGKTEASFQVDGSKIGKGEDTFVISVPGAMNTLRLPVSSSKAWLEQEPNDARDQAQTISIGEGISGTISKRGDEDRFAFTASKGDKLSASVQSSDLGFPLDAWLRVEDSTGKELSKDDDGRTSPDPGINWTAPSDGKFFACVGSTLHRGGSDHIYHLKLTKAEPEYEITVAANAFAIAPGQTNEVKVTTRRRNGHSAKLTITAANLPSGVTLSPFEVPSKDGDATLKLIATSGAKPANGPFQLHVTEQTGTTKMLYHELTSRGIDNGVPQGFNLLVIEKTDQLWLTVLPPKAGKK